MSETSSESLNLAISVVLPTIFRRDLIKSTIDSILPQLKCNDELLISLNVENVEFEKCLNELKIFVEQRQTACLGKVRYITPGQKLKVYAHWNFAISETANNQIIFIHDDEIYNANIVDISRKEFAADPEVTVIMGGQINVYSSSTKINSFKKIWFDERSVWRPREWLYKQSNPSLPKFSATSYIFRKQEKSFWFFERDYRVSDSLLVYHLAIKGKVVERPEFFGTHLHHASNTFLTYFLEEDHLPYWEGLRRMGEIEQEEWLIQASRTVKNEASTHYSLNALFAALPLGNRRGWAECVRQCRLAGAEPSLLMRLTQRVPFMWQILPPVVRFLKILRHKFGGHKEKMACASNAVKLATALGLSTEIVQKFELCAQENSR